MDGSKTKHMACPPVEIEVAFDDQRSNPAQNEQEAKHAKN